MKWLIASALALAAAVIITRQRMAEEEAQAYQAEPDPAPPEDAPLFSFPDVSLPSIDWPAWTGIGTDDLPQQTNTPLENLMISTQQLAGSFTSDAPAVAPSVAAANRRAFLDMIAYAEGADYNVIFGGGTFSSFADHPRQLIPFTDGAGRRLKSSAAGRYQFLQGTWDTLKARLGLPDFGPASQDAAALELIREKGALADVDAGRFTTAVNKVAKVWASLPGAGYAQPERKLSSLLAAYMAAGGTLEA